MPRRIWVPPEPYDLALTLRVLRRGRSDLPAGVGRHLVAYVPHTRSAWLYENRAYRRGHCEEWEVIQEFRSAASAWMMFLRCISRPSLMSPARVSILSMMAYASV